MKCSRDSTKFQGFHFVRSDSAQSISSRALLHFLDPNLELLTILCTYTVIEQAIIRISQSTCFDRKICAICKVDVSVHSNNVKMAVECEKSVEALVTHLRTPVSQSNSLAHKATTSKTLSPVISVSDDDSGCGGSSGCNGDNTLYEWCPDSLTPDQITAFFSGYFLKHS